MARLTASQRRKKQAEIRANRKPLITKGVGKGQGNRGRGTGRARGTVLVPKKSTTTTKKKTKHASPYKTIEQKNREMFGDKKIDALKIKTQKFKDNRAEMQRLRKNNPEEYKRRKKKQRKAENLASFRAGSHTWD